MCGNFVMIDHAAYAFFILAGLCAGASITLDLARFFGRNGR
jgi:hypothetical protein